jgi:mono/diheme cytochrome c family protein
MRSEVKRRMIAALLIGGAVIVVALTQAAPGGAQQARAVEFNRDIRPILSDKCFACHGPDATAKKIKLRLDSEAAATADLGRGRRAIVPGQPERSELVRRITHADEAMRMPPTYSGRTLTQPEIELLTEWIRQGAKWQSHWAFVAPVRPPLPPVKNAAWPRNAVDYFVLARLEREGLRPAPEADRARLLRRVSFDLTGLPPTPEELDDFLKDQSPDAYEKVVDRLLASPRYGERMAFKWLDAARYADTSGYQSDRERQMWRWRDWVIDAFNQNKRYDQFIVEQLAGDLLPNATMEQRLATGFNRNHRGNSEGGILAEEYEVEYAIDRVDTMATAFLGLTAGCARCHNHKYDPLTQREYYQFFAYFNSIPENGIHLRAGNTPPTSPAPTAEQRRQARQLETEIAALEKRFAAWKPRIQRAQRAWEQSLAASVTTQHWFPGDGLAAHFALDGGDSRLAGDAVKHQPGRIGRAAEFDGRATLRTKEAMTVTDAAPFTLSAWIYPTAENAGAVLTCAEEAKPSDETPAGEAAMGAGYALSLAGGKLQFNLVSIWPFDAIRVETKNKLALNRWHHVLARYDGRRTKYGAAVFVDGRRQELKEAGDSLSEPFSVTRPLSIGGASGGISGEGRAFHGLIDEVRVYDVPLSERQIAVLANANPLDAIARAAGRTESDGDKLRGAFLSTAAPADARRAWQRLSSLKLEKARLEAAFPTVMVMEELAEPRPAFVLKRGSYDAPGERVARGVPAALPLLPEGAPNNRLGLAEWLVQPSHPLTARVAVNRFWQMLFGTGLVKTAEDFGAQGEWPSHPELLDWLAVEFRDGYGTGSGSDPVGSRQRNFGNPLATARGSAAWDVKALLKTIVTSATYRQSSRASAELIARDPENRLLARGPRLRLPAEMIRDQALFASGLLVEQVGGPSVKPYQPEGLYDGLVGSGLVYRQDHGEKLYRRSLYTFWKRTIAPPFMANFDAAGRDSCAVRETRTNTPLQALNLMNDVAYVEAARVLAERAMREGGRTAEARLRLMFRLATARDPKPRESRVLQENLRAQLEAFRRDPAKAARLLGVGEKKADVRLDAQELAAYATVASLILNLDEVVTKE